MRRNAAWYLPVLACASLVLAACGDAVLATEPDLAGPSNTYELAPVVVDGSPCSEPTWVRYPDGTCWPPDPSGGDGPPPPDGGEPGAGDAWDGGGGGPGDKDDEEEPEPCATGDSVIDSEEIQAAFADLWIRSNPGAHLWARREQGGWIVRTADGQFRVEPWTNVSSSHCGIDGEAPDPQTGTVVGFVHTHPYNIGENITNCDGQVVTYTGGPSAQDRTQSWNFAQRFGWGTGLPGYVIDGNQITSFVGRNSMFDRNHNRCGPHL